jgi:Mg2+ and Co2+ transporter CorA
MNVNFPFEADEGAFWAILGAMVGVLVSFVAYFRSRGWL